MKPIQEPPLKLNDGISPAQTDDRPGVGAAQHSVPASAQTTGRLPVPGRSSSWLAAALAELQRDLPKIRKAETAEVEGETKTGKRFSYTYSYADLSAISEQILPRMGALGLSFIAKPTFVEGRFVLAYSLLHTSGEREDGEYPLPASGSPQAIGSAITYGRRYCLCAVTGVAPEDDDDGAAASAQVDRELEHARDKFRAAWLTNLGEFKLEDANRWWREFSRGGSLQSASPAELRRAAAYLSAMPDRDAGGDPATATPTTDANGEPVQDVSSPRPMTSAQRTKINAILSPMYGKDRAARLAALSVLAGRKVESSSDLTFHEAHQAINDLEAGEEPVEATGGGS